MKLFDLYRFSFTMFLQQHFVSYLRLRDVIFFFSEQRLPLVFFRHDFGSSLSFHNLHEGWSDWKGGP